MNKIQLLPGALGIREDTISGRYWAPDEPFSVMNPSSYEFKLSLLEVQQKIYDERTVLGILRKIKFPEPTEALEQLRVCLDDQIEEYNRCQGAEEDFVNPCPLDDVTKEKIFVHSQNFIDINQDCTLALDEFDPHALDHRRAMARAAGDKLGLFCRKAIASLHLTDPALVQYVVYITRRRNSVVLGQSVTQNEHGLLDVVVAQEEKFVRRADAPRPNIYIPYSSEHIFTLETYYCGELVQTIEQTRTSWEWKFVQVSLKYDFKDRQREMWTYLVDVGQFARQKNIRVQDAVALIQENVDVAPRHYIYAIRDGYADIAEDADPDHFRAMRGELCFKSKPKAMLIETLSVHLWQKDITDILNKHLCRSLCNQPIRLPHTY
jgi:hypothetical protein